MKRLLMTVGLCLVGMGTAHAQTCLGALSYAMAPTHVGVDAAFTSSSHNFGGGVSHGNGNWFAHGGAEFLGFDFDHATGVFGSGGVERTIDAAKKYHLCPTVSVLKLWGPSGSPEFTTSSLLINAGAAVGFMAGKAGNADVVPTVSVTFNHLTQSFSGSFFGIDNSFSQNFGSLQAGAGFLLNQKMSLTPVVIVPFGSDIGETAFGVVFSMKIGQ